MRKKNVLVYMGVFATIFGMLNVAAKEIDNYESQMNNEVANSCKINDNSNTELDSDIILGADWYDSKGNLLPIISYKEIFTKSIIEYDENGNVVVENSTEITDEEYENIEPYTWCGNDERCWETTSKKLSIALLSDLDAGGYPNVKFAVVNNWKKLPKVRSYDNIGIILSNASYIKINNTYGYQWYNDSENPSTKYNVKYTLQGNNMRYYVNKYYTGISISQNLLNHANTILQNQLFVVAQLNQDVGTFATAAYEHAVEDISLDGARDFEFSLNGMGRVFKWNTSSSKWDNMQGVCLNIGQQSGDILWEC